MDIMRDSEVYTDRNISVKLDTDDELDTIRLVVHCFCLVLHRFHQSLPVEKRSKIAFLLECKPHADHRSQIVCFAHRK